jgi:hypothetical protein
MQNISRIAVGLAATSMLTLGSAGMANAATHTGGWWNHHHHHHNSKKVDISKSFNTVNKKEAELFSHIDEWDDSPVCVNLNGGSRENEQNITCPVVNVRNSPFSLVVVLPND